MSTSSHDAQSELERASCSYFSDALDGDLLTGIFERVVAALPLHDVLRLRETCSIANRAIASALSRHEHIRIEVREADEFRLVGIRRERNPDRTPLILVQGSRVSLEEGVRCVQKLLDSSVLIRRLTLCIHDRELSNLNALVEPILCSEKVKLEVLRVTRREGGVPVPVLSSLIRRHSSTLKYVGRVGIHEAALAFDSQLHLSRCSLMTFDVGLDAPCSLVADYLVRLASSGASFDHLSFTSFTGLDPSDDVVQSFLDACLVRSLRLTMMRGPFVEPRPDYLLSKVRRVERLELGEVVSKPNIFNSLVQYEKLFKKVFPNVQYITFFQHW